MTATNVTNALQAVIERLQSEQSGLLAGVGIGYEMSDDLGQSAIYAGGDESEQEADVAENWGVLQLETALVTVYIQVQMSPPVSRIDTDKECARIASVVAKIFYEQPKLAGDMTWLGIASTRGDYQQTDTTTRSWRLLRMKIQSYLSWSA